MKGKTLTDIYNEKKKLPTPAAKFIAELCELTHRSRITVIMWVKGRVRPDINTTYHRHAPQDRCRDIVP